MGKIILSYNDKLRMQPLWQVSQSHCLVYAERLSQSVDPNADFLNSAELPPFVTVTGNGFPTKSLLTKRLHAQFVVVRQFSHS